MDKIIENESSNKLIIYAELSKKQYSKITSGYYSIELPEGVIMKNKPNKRGLFFYCNDNTISDIIVEALDSDGINWTYIK